jgi:hypothetical protein
MVGVSSSGVTASEVEAVAQNSVFERLARGGYVMSGILHVLIGYLAIRIAFGSESGNADSSGALATVANRRGGGIALWLATTAFLFMALWRLVETVLGRSTDPKSQTALAEAADRAKALSLAVVYFAFAYSAYGFACGIRRRTAVKRAVGGRQMGYRSPISIVDHGFLPGVPMTNTDAQPVVQYGVQTQVGKTVIQYGVQTPASKTVLLLTDRLDEAENILDVVGEGRILQRTLEYGPWRPVNLPAIVAHAEAS